MSASMASVPCFLLPLRSQLWRRAGNLGAPTNGAVAVVVRFASTSKPSKPVSGKPLVLEKPLRFNPPSHGARLPKKQPKHYGGELSAEESKFQARRDYPGMPPPRDSKAHWFLHNKKIHLFITMGTLTGLAVYTFVQNFKSTSPYIEMVPTWSEFLWHPFSSLATLVRMVQLTEQHNSAIVAEKRNKNVDDVIKRRRYRKAHGIDESEGVAGWFKGNSGPVDPEEEDSQSRETAEQAVAVPADHGVAPAAPASEEEGAGNGKRKKFLGIF